MAATKKVTNQGVIYFLTNAHGSLVKVQQGQPAFSTGTATMLIAADGGAVLLSPQNVADMLPALTAFSTTGVVS